MEPLLHEPLLGERETARLLGISPRTLQRWRWAGGGPPYLKIGGRVRYAKCVLESYLAQSKRQPGIRNRGTAKADDCPGGAND